MDKTEEYQRKEEMALKIRRKIEKPQKQWQHLDEDEKSLSINANGGVEISVELENAFEKLKNGKKELENGYCKSYDEVKVEMEKISEMNVYYDKEEGIWKCRNCPWTYKSGSPLKEHIEHPIWNLHMPINPKIGNRQESCVYCEIQGENTHINGEPLKQNGRNKYSSEITEEPVDVGIEESGEKSTEFDVEKILDEQDTHDLFCPNCNSCITKKVILRKRKRKIHISSEDAKRNKVEPDDNLPLFPDDTTLESDVEVFRCLSCFSFFTSSGSCAFPNETQPKHENVYSITQLSVKTSSSKESLTVGNSHLNQKINGIKSMETADKNYSSGDSLSATVEIKANTTYIEEPIKAGAASDTIITIQESIAPIATREPQGLRMVETWPLPYIKRVEYENFQGIEIVKSIVYGGLAEFIASLSIVSSAVGADTATLKILALGLANLIGGLFIIAQNLRELKNDNQSTPSDKIMVANSIPLAANQDRYQQLLGRRDNFWAHATIALLSYIIFAMLPPIIYAFSFRESDNKDYKLITVAAASLVCILILSIGKAYIQRPPKAYSKTVSYYVVIVLISSGVCYAFGDLFKQLFENLGWFV